MFGLIEKLRVKPDRAKKQIAFLIAFLFAGIIFVVWLSAIFPSWRQGQLKEAAASNLEPSPISTFIGTFSSGISAISAEFGQLKDSISSFSTAPAYYNSTSSQQ